MKPLTTFGKELRKRRIDRAETLFSMATQIGVTSAYLSAVETGRKRVSEDVFRRITGHFGLEMAEIEILKILADESAPSVKISLLKADDEARSVAAMFARTFHDMEPEKMRGLKKYLENILEQRVEAEPDDRYRD